MSEWSQIAADILYYFGTRFRNLTGVNSQQFVNLQLIKTDGLTQCVIIVGTVDYADPEWLTLKNERKFGD